MDRFTQLRNDIDEYSKIKDTILTGIEDYEKIEYQKQKILDYFNATEADYDNYKWQLKNRFTSSKGLREIINISDENFSHINEIALKYRFAISPYYLSVIEPDNPLCGVRKQSIPTISELEDIGELDPMDEEGTTINEIITKRYPDRLIIKITNICGMFFRFLLARRK